MKEIALTQGKVTVVDDKDYESLSKFKWYAIKYHNTFYAVRATSRKDGKRKRIRLHREILKPSRGMQTDHKDGNGLNNQRNNLRNATSAQNNQNRQKQKGTTSQFKGVYWHRNRHK